MSNDRRRPPPADKKHVVRDVRSPHGTRVMKSIVCSRCGKQDQLPFTPKEQGPFLCRDCSAEVTGMVIEGDSRSADRMLACDNCGKRYPAEPKMKRPPPVEPRPDDAMQYVPKDTRQLCFECRQKDNVEKRAKAHKPRGVHPIVVKKKTAGK